jgi:hypothetical protein
LIRFTSTKVHNKKMSILFADLMLSWTLVAFGADEFSPGCAVPFKAIQTTGLDTDKQCGIDGGSDEDAEKAESAFRPFRADRWCSGGAADERHSWAG